MRYPGGKNGAGVWQTIINQMPPHRVYVEAFVGSGAVLRHKRPAEESYAIDKDAAAIGSIGDAVPGLSAVCDDGILWLENWAAAGCVDSSHLVYCDPPYLPSARSSGRKIYSQEMTEEDHCRLLDVLLKFQGLVIISGYQSELYRERLRGWRTYTFQTMSRGGLRWEWLWMNFPKPTALHDYRWLGHNFRERARIKKRKLRWRAKLSSMDEIERLALMSEIADLASPKVASGASERRMPVLAEMKFRRTPKPAAGMGLGSTDLNPPMSGQQIVNQNAL